MGTNAMRCDARRCDAMRGNGWMRARDRGGVALVPLAAVSQLPTGTLCGGGMNAKMEGRGLQRGRRKGKEDGERLGGGPGGGRKPRNPLFAAKVWHRLLPGAGF